MFGHAAVCNQERNSAPCYPCVRELGLLPHGPMRCPSLPRHSHHIVCKDLQLAVLHPACLPPRMRLLAPLPTVCEFQRSAAMHRLGLVYPAFSALRSKAHAQIAVSLSAESAWCSSPSFRCPSIARLQRTPWPTDGRSFRSLWATLSTYILARWPCIIATLINTHTTRASDMTTSLHSALALTMHFYG